MATDCYWAWSEIEVKKAPKKDKSWTCSGKARNNLYKRRKIWLFFTQGLENWLEGCALIREMLQEKNDSNFDLRLQTESVAWARQRLLRKLRFVRFAEHVIRTRGAQQKSIDSNRRRENWNCDLSPDCIIGITSTLPYVTLQLSPHLSCVIFLTEWRVGT